MKAHLPLSTATHLLGLYRLFIEQLCFQTGLIGAVNPSRTGAIAGGGFNVLPLLLTAYKKQIFSFRI